jgi:hypothetical protein
MIKRLLSVLYTNILLLPHYLRPQSNFHQPREHSSRFFLNLIYITLALSRRAVRMRCGDLFFRSHTHTRETRTAGHRTAQIYVLCHRESRCAGRPDFAPRCGQIYMHYGWLKFIRLFSLTMCEKRLFLVLKHNAAFCAI